MDDSTPRHGPFTEITVRIPEDLARRLGTEDEVERRALEALALEEYKLGHLTKTDLRRLLGLGTHDALDGFLKEHGADEASAVQAPERQAEARQAAANIIARRKGVTLGGLKIKDLINEGRP